MRFRDIAKILAFSVFSVMCFIQCYTIMRSYLEHPTVIDLHDASKDLIDIMPALTICNNNRLSLKKLVYRNSTIQEKFNKTFPNWNPNKHYVDVKEFNSFRDKVATIFKDLNYSPQDEMDNATMNDLFVMKPDRFPFITWLGCARTWNKSIDCEMLNHVESVQDRRCTTILHRGALYHDQKQRPHLFNGEKLIPDYRNDSYFNAKEVVKVLINFEPGDYADLKRQIGSRIIFHGNNYVASMTEPDFFVTRGFKYDFNVDREDVILENDAKGCTDYDENLPLYKNRVDARTPLYGETCFQNCVIKNVIHRSNCWPTTMPYYRNDSYDPKLEIKSCPWFREPPYFAIYRELLRVEQLLEAANQTSESTSSQSTTVDPLTPAGGSGNLFKEEMRAYMKIRRHCWNKCQHACTLTKYSVAVSKSVWPSDVDIELDKTTWYREFRQCCALVTVKYSHFYYNVHEFMPKYNLVDVIGNLGGLLAVWLNLSIVEFYHAIQKLLTFFGEQSFSKLNTYISSLKL